MPPHDEEESFANNIVTPTTAEAGTRVPITQEDTGIATTTKITSTTTTMEDNSNDNMPPPLQEEPEDNTGEQPKEKGCSKEVTFQNENINGKEEEDIAATAKSTELASGTATLVKTQPPHEDKNEPTTKTSTKMTPTETMVGPLLRRGSLVALVVWVVGLLVIFTACPADSFQYLSTEEWNANAVVWWVLFSTNLSRLAHLVLRDSRSGGLGGGLQFVNTGILVGSVMIQGIAMLSILLMMSVPTPILVDPVTGLRTHMVRWIEWIVLAFLMTFLTESIELESGTTFTAWKCGIALGVSTAAGAIFPFCTSWKQWSMVFGCSWFLFMNLYIRLYQRYTRFAKLQKKQPNALTAASSSSAAGGSSPAGGVMAATAAAASEAQLLAFDRAKYSFKTVLVCSVAWTLLAASYSVLAITRNSVPKDHIFQSESLVLITESFFELLSKVWYFQILLEVHTNLFDDAHRTMQRLEELRVVMSTIWNTSSDVMVWCSQDDGDDGDDDTEGTHKTKSRKIHAVVSPSFFEFAGTPVQEQQWKTTEGGQKIKKIAAPHPTLILEIDVEQQTYIHHTLQLELGKTVTREDAVDLIMSSAQRARKEDPNKDTATTPISDQMEHNIGVLANLLIQVFRETNKNHDESSMVLLENGFEAKPSTTRLATSDGVRSLCCEAKVSKVEGSSCLVVLRDISERFERFETEKKLVEEITARQKDAEANRFTRHEVKNSILACIGVLESMRGSAKEHSLPGTQPTIIEQDEDLDPPFLPTLQDNNTDDNDDDAPTPRSNPAQLQGAESISSETFSAALDFLSFEEHAGELDHTLRSVLDTIMDHTMSREVIYEEYEVRKERIYVPDTLRNIRRSASSSMGPRFNMQATPKEPGFPILATDPRLLRYIYQNALSNACRYGERGGAVDTNIYYDTALQEFRLEVVNLPGYGHENLLQLTYDQVQEKVFSPRTRLQNMEAEKHESHNESSSNHYSTGDGAWIMSKCARMLRGRCELRFEPHQTTFAFWCPAKAYFNKDLKEPDLRALPAGTWGIAIDDSKIQRKLMDRFLKIAGIEESRRVVLGGTADEIYGFNDHVVKLVKSNPDDKFLIIADENLDVLEGSVMHGSVSGSMCLQKILERLQGEDNARVLALVRSANDSAKDTELYKARSHGYLVKAPIDKNGVLKTIQPWWFRRFKASRSLPVSSSADLDSSDRSLGSDELDDYDPFVDIRASLKVLNALSMTSHSSLLKRWRSIQDRLHALKGDLKSTITMGGPELVQIIKKIEELRAGGRPDSLIEDWKTLQTNIETLLDSQKANFLSYGNLGYT